MFIAAAPQILEHPCCDIINELPWGFFLAVHIVLFAIGAAFAIRAFDARKTLFGAGFGLFAVAELVYLTYHVNITQFLFAHTIAEVLDAAAFVLVFVAVAESLRGAPAHVTASRDRAGASR